MKIQWHEIKSDTDLHWSGTEAEPWLKKLVYALDEVADPLDKQSRKILAKIDARKVDDLVVFTGKLSTSLQLCCSRCGQEFTYPIQSKISALFSKDPDMAGLAHLKTGKDRIARPVGQNHGYARHEHDWEGDDLGLHAKDLDITYVSNDFIDLSEVLTEQIQIEVPFQPICKESCKGVCFQCGTDLNVGKCVCAPTRKKNPFEALQTKKWKDLET